MIQTRKQFRPERSHQRISIWLVLMFAMVSTVVWTYPLAERIGDSIPNGVHEEYGHGSGDQMLSFWIVNTSGENIYSNFSSLFDGGIFYPMRDSLAYSESMLAAGAIVHPIRRLTGNPILAGNLYFLGSLIASFIGVFLLVREISHDDRAGIVAGLFFAFTGDRWLIPWHLPGQSVQFIPFIFLFCLRCIERPSWTNLVVLMVLNIANTLGCVYYALFTPFLLIPWALVLMVGRQGTIRSWGLTIAAVSAGVLAALPVFIPYLRVQEALPIYVRFPAGRHLFGIYVDAFREPLAYVASVLSPEVDVFAASPLPILLSLIALALAGVRPISRSGFAKERIRIIAFLVLGLCGMFVSFGSMIHEGLGVPGPFALISSLPGFSSMSGTRRVLIYATFAGSICVGAAFTAILRRINRVRWQNMVALGFLGLTAVDTGLLQGPWPVYGRFGPQHLPAAHRWLGTTPKGTAILELPAGDFLSATDNSETRPMIWSLYHDRPIMNGYSARLPLFARVVNSFPEEPGMQTLQAAGISYVFVDRNKMEATTDGARRLAEMQLRSDLQPVWHDDILVLTVPPSKLEAEIAPRGRALDNRGWFVLGAGTRSALLADGDLATHALALKRNPYSFLRVNLGREVRVSAIRLRLGARLLDLPQGYELLSSLDGVHWEKFGERAITIPPFASYREDPDDIVLDLDMEPTLARVIEIRAPGNGPRWGAHEIEIYTDEPLGAR